MSKSSEQTPLLNGVAYTSSFEDDSNLTKYRKAIGINIDLVLDGGDLEAARKGARGLYKQIIVRQRTWSRQYKLIETLYYVAVGAQIVIGATLASFGPLAKLHNTAITVLGVVNAATAGFLAVLKGQGLPDRLRKDQYVMRTVQDFIEETEIKLAVGGEAELSQQELDELVGEVFERYNIARDTAEMNKPSSYGRRVEGQTNKKGNANNNVVDKLVTSGESKGKGQAKFIID